MVAKSFINPPPGVKCSKKLEDAVSARSFRCDIESGFSFSNVNASPDTNEIKSICQSADCRLLFDAMRAASPGECVTWSGWYLYADLMNPVLKQCPAFTGPAVTGEAPFNGNASATATAALASPTTVTPGAPTTRTITPGFPAWPVVATQAPPPAAPASTTVSPDSQLIDTGAKLVDKALTRGTIIAIISASVFVLSIVVALVKFLYERRQRKKKERLDANAAAGRRSTGQSEAQGKPNTAGNTARRTGTETPTKPSTTANTARRTDEFTDYYDRYNSYCSYLDDSE